MVAYIIIGEKDGIISELRKQLELSQVNITDLQTDYKKLKTKLIAFEVTTVPPISPVISVGDENGSVGSENNQVELEKKVKELQHQIDLLNVSTLQKDGVIQSMKTELRISQASKLDLEHSHEQLRKQLSHVNTTMSMVQERDVNTSVLGSGGLNRSILVEEAQQDSLQAREQLKEISLKNTELQIEIKTLKDILETKTDDNLNQDNMSLSELKFTNVILSNSLQQTKQDLEYNTTRLSQLTDKAQREQDGLNSRITELQNLCHTHETETSEARLAKQQLETVISELQDKMSAQNEQISDLENERMDRNDHVDRLEREQVQLRLDSESLTEVSYNLDQQREENRMQQRELHVAMDGANELRNQLSLVEDEKRELEESVKVLDETKEEVKQLNQKIISLNEIIAELREEIETLEVFISLSLSLSLCVCECGGVGGWMSMLVTKHSIIFDRLNSLSLSLSLSLSFWLILFFVL